ncbi:hypothetical protein M9H77_08400 [Catharanthus roseus]|uniref:Uncharacterized protein n=1 Tax=Catharanthus roseus TaxID=4058 RepID=A0ACC0BXS8_CATRO|nr:hypothetical protein M9H77_08400 [Catharanthus roseus]
MEDVSHHVQQIRQALKGLEQQFSCLAKNVKDLKREEEANYEQNERFHKRRDDYEGYYDSYNYGGCSYRRSSQTLGTTSRPLSYNNLKLSLLFGTFGPYDYEAWEQKVQAKENFMESSMGEMSTKANELSQAQGAIHRKVIHYEKKNTCTLVKEEKSRQKKVKSVVSTKESEGKMKENEFLIENFESLKEEQVEEKQDEIEKSEETKEDMRLRIFEGDKREKMKESCCDISSSLNSLSNEEVNLFTNSNNHFLSCFSPSMQKFEAQKMENEGSLGYKLYKTKSFLLSTSFLSFDFIINESNSCSFSFFCDRIQSQFLHFLTTTCGTKLNHRMEAKEEGMGKAFLYYYEFSFKELKLFLELYAAFVTLAGNVMVNPFTSVGI